MPSQSVYKADPWGELLGKGEVRPHGYSFCESTGGALPAFWHSWPAAEGHHWTGVAAPLQLSQCPPAPAPGATWRSRGRLWIYADKQPRFRFASFLFELLTNCNAIKKNVIRSCKRLRNMHSCLGCHDRQGGWDKKMKG